MILKYELACKEAGLSEEQTAEIRRYFDAEKKRLKRRNAAMERNEITYFSIADAFEDLGKDLDYDIPDASIDVEEEVLHRMDLERLRELMDELSPEDQNFLQIYFEEASGAERRVMERLGITRKKVRCWKTRLIKSMQERFYE